MTARLAPRHSSCGWCGEPIPADKRAHSSYCSASHEVMASRARRRRARDPRQNAPVRAFDGQRRANGPARRSDARIGVVGRRNREKGGSPGIVAGLSAPVGMAAVDDPITSQAEQ